MLETAAGVFARKGYHGATTAELADAAGITEPILYRHFKNKLDLFVNLVDEVGREVIAAWQRNLEGVSDPHDRLKVLLQGNPATHQRGRGIYRVIFQAMTDASSDRRILTAIRRHVNSLQDFLERELIALQSSGAIRRDAKPSHLAMLLIDVAIGFGMLTGLRATHHADDGDKVHLQRLLDEVLCE